MSSLLIGLALIVLIASAAVALGALSARIAARIDGGRPDLRDGRIAAQLAPDATVPQARLRQEEQARTEPMQRLSPLEREGMPHHSMTFIGLR